MNLPNEPLTEIHEKVEILWDYEQNIIPIKFSKTYDDLNKKKLVQ